MEFVLQIIFQVKNLCLYPPEIYIDKGKCNRFVLYLGKRGIKCWQVVCHAKKANRTNSTFGFADTIANTGQPKDLFFANAPQKRSVNIDKR
jgi:hypothetical protein